MLACTCVFACVCVLRCLGNKGRKHHKPEHAFHLKNICAIIKLHTKIIKFIHPFRKHLATDSSVQCECADPVQRWQEATCLCYQASCWIKELTLMKLLIMWKKQVWNFSEGLAMLHVYIKITKIWNRPGVFTLQNKADKFTLHIRTAASAYWPQRLSMLKQLSKCFAG